MHPPKALAPGPVALDLRLGRKSEPGQTKQKEWKTARIKVSFSLSDPDCNASPSVRPNAAAQSSRSTPVMRDGECVTVSPALNLPGAGRCSTRHCKMVPKILKKKNPDASKKGPNSNEGCKGLICKTMSYAFLEGKGDERR